MLSVAIVEDESSFSDLLSSYLNQYSDAHGESFSVSTFINGIEFLNNYSANYDIIFMDIEMPFMNGMETAQKLRKIDHSAVLIFITNLARYAIKGYEVDAMDYILKPLNYPAFAMKMQKAIRLCQKKQEEKITIATRTGSICFPASSVFYIESVGHHMEYHTEHGLYTGYGTLKKLEEQLPRTIFFRCNSCYIINFHFVKGYDGNTVQVGDTTLTISRARKKQFLEALHQFYISRGWIGS